MTFSECASERAHRVSKFTLIRSKHLVVVKKKKRDGDRKNNLQTDATL